MKAKIYPVILIVVLTFMSLSASAQFAEPQFEKMTKDRRAWFMKRFDNIKWTGQGLYDATQMDKKQTNRLRARLQSRFGDPTQTIEDLIHKKGFRPGKAIEFEYWFTVDDSIPLMVLDVDGPFGNGLVYGGASRYIDLMPQIKRTLSKNLMQNNTPAKFQDYFYSPEREQWFDVRYENGAYTNKEISTPQGMTIDYDY